MQVLLIDRLPRRLNDRLCNWGDVMRDRHRKGESATYRICHNMSKHAGKTRELENDRIDERDFLDAELMEGHWSATFHLMKHEQRGIIRAHYVEAAYWKVTCRMLRIQPREYDNVLVNAVVNFANFVAIREMPVHNPLQITDTV